MSRDDAGIDRDEVVAPAAGHPAPRVQEVTPESRRIAARRSMSRHMYANFAGLSANGTYFIS
jgi:hypothetical protein